ncbi:MAG TPA: hypothetical protein VGE08_20285 [Steroidobacter sp.]|uniref:hypothetical protein n=1 Tax=Steroidobacter sp. TaxID=1978227 RepID=UPI002ED85B16
MSRTVNTIVIWALALHRRPTLLKEYQEQTQVLLAGLQRSHPEFRHLLGVSSRTTRAISPDLTGLADDIAALVYDDLHPADYLHLTEQGGLGPSTLSKIGFSVTYGLLDPDGSMMPIERGGARLMLQGSSASPEPDSTAVLEVTEAASCIDSLDSCSFKELLSYLLTNWPSSFGGVSVADYQQRIRGSNRASYAGQWLYYLPFPSLARCLPPDIHHEPFANGILIQTTPHIPDVNNPADIAAGLRVRDVLDEFGLVNDATYAIEGWPPDQEEMLYEQFISGAPPDRKYMVHCINFDGYDASRKVLLYAKLFRRLKRHPKEWGLRGWDGPVLNEAKRQVRAAAKAGGVPIEWHIGLEEPAHQVRQLLADYTNITEHQLRVIYTPLEEALTRMQR